MWWSDEFKAIQQSEKEATEAAYDVKLFDKYHIRFKDLVYNDDLDGSDDGCYHYVHKNGKDRYVLAFVDFDNEWFTYSDFDDHYRDRPV